MQIRSVVLGYYPHKLCQENWLLHEDHVTFLCKLRSIEILINWAEGCLYKLHRNWSYEQKECVPSVKSIWKKSKWVSVLSGFKGGGDKLKKQVKIRNEVPPETAVFFEIIFLAPKWFPNLIIIRSFNYVQIFSKFSRFRIRKTSNNVTRAFCRFVGRSNDFSCTPLGPISFLFMQFSTKNC